MGNKLILLSVLFFSLFMRGQEKDSTITLSTRVAREIVKDLVKGDYCEKQVIAQKELITQLEQKIELKDTIISSFEHTERLNEQIKENYKTQLKNTEKDLRKANRKNIVNKILLYSSLALSGYLILK